MLTFAFGEAYREPCALVLGGFDGLHLGHRALFAEVKKSGLPVVFTSMFGGKGKCLFTREERREIFARAGVAAVCEIGLDERLRAMPAEEFAGELLERIAARAVYCGEDFRFGKDALGTPKLIERYANCPVFVHPTVKYFAKSGRARKFSATRCKELLKSGDLPALNACLAAADDFDGGAYFVRGIVEHGREVGRTYGFPTANLSVSAEKLLPPDGVYGGVCRTPYGEFPCIANFGARPTFGVEEKKIEAYLDGFAGDLYGAAVSVVPTEFFRGIEKFSSAAALKTQLERDIQRLREKYR